MVIPNKEIREVYKLQIQEWFKNTVLSNTEQLTSFWNAIQTGKAEVIETYLNRILSNSISVFDTKARNEEKESSYHTLLIGLLAGNSNWLVKSNIEAGDGFADIIIETEDPDAGIVIELKYSKEFSGLDTACEKAIAQIHDRKYENYLKNDGRYNILLYLRLYRLILERVIQKNMGRFVNPDNSAFQVALNSRIYVDKTGLIEYTNSVLDTTNAYICNSRPRRFGKSYAANMLAAYYSKGAESEQMFSGLEISKNTDFKKHLNKYVIHIDIQWFLANCDDTDNVVPFITKSVLDELCEVYPEVLPLEVTTLPDALSRIKICRYY